MAFTTPCIRLKCPCGRGAQGQAVWNSFAPSWARTARPPRFGRDPAANIAPAVTPAAAPIRWRRLSTISSNLCSIAIGISLRASFLCPLHHCRAPNSLADGVVISGRARRPPFSRRDVLVAPSTRAMFANDDVAGNLAVVANVCQRRYDLVAETGHEIGAARVEHATAGQSCQIRDIQAPQLELVLAARQIGIGFGNRRRQRPPIGMEWPADDLRGAAKLDQLSDVHDA